LANVLETALPFGLRTLQSHEFGGFLLSSVIGVSGIAFSLPLGILLALGRQSDLFVVKTTCVAFIEGFRGVPLITLLFVASLLLNYFLPPGTEFDVILRVIIMVTIFSAAYMAEVVRGGLAALPRGQYEAADALGLDYWQAQRLIIMPQALKVSIPGIVGNFIGLFKDTTLVSFISLQDPLQRVASIRANQEWNGIYWELFMFVGFLFFLFCFSMSRYSMYLEGKLKTDHR
jgi:general L-amino acid transport system permease protein